MKKLWAQSTISNGENKKKASNKLNFKTAITKLLESYYPSGACKRISVALKFFRLASSEAGYHYNFIDTNIEMKCLFVHFNLFSFVLIYSSGGLLWRIL